MEGADAAIGVLVQNLINVIKEERSLIQGLNQDVVQLQKTLEMIQSYLNDAEKKSISQDAVKIWLRDLESLAFDADNVLDDINYYHLHKKVNKMKSKKDKVLSIFSSSDHIPRRRNMALAIKKINIEFESINKRATDLGLQSILVNAPPLVASHASFETNSFTLDPIFIGRDDVVSELVNKVVETRQQESILSILAIVGMGGLGKTTLTKKVFHHEKIKNLFGSLIWVHVSQTFDPMVLFKKILKDLTSQSDYQVESKQDILKRLQEALKDKTYLLVLDDSWNENPLLWEDFINSIKGVTSTKGNAIMMTTRSKEVASIVKPLYMQCLEGLSEEECWSIIKAKTLEDGEGFESIGREIARRCQGLPLAANVVGGVLHGKTNQEWSSIKENWVADGEGGENILKILKLSYDHLASPSLKKCFTYCSIFRKGMGFRKQEVIEMWMAEGFLEDDGRNSMESVGNKFFNVLMHNSLLQASRRDYRRNVDVFVIHDLVHDMASSVIGSSRYMNYNGRQEANPIAKNVAKHLRSLFVNGDISHLSYSDFESLHVFVVSDYSGKELPKSVRKLIHLRYLDILKTGIENLPEWIGELHHLQTLRADTYGLKKLPSTLKCLINLRHLYIRNDAELPAEIGRLTSLQTLECFRVGDKKGYQIEELGRLNNLGGSLSIYNLEKVRDKEEALKANIIEKANLVDLSLKWDEKNRELGEGGNDESVLEGLQPHPNLIKLGIEGFKGKRFPLWTQHLSNLNSLRLEGLEGLESLPDGLFYNNQNLSELRITDCPKLRELPDGLVTLNSLRLKGLEGLESLPDGLFYNNQNLSELRITDCPKLRELPDGLVTLNSPKELQIRECPNLEMRNNNNTIGGGQMVKPWARSLETLILDDLMSVNDLSMFIGCLAKSSRLRELRIKGVPLLMDTWKVESWCLSSLEYLEIDVSKESSRVGIKENVDGILESCSKSLTDLSLKGMEDWEWLPESIQHLTNLSSLSLRNLGVEEMPLWFGNLISLKWLGLVSCKRLRSVGSSASGSSHFINNLQFLSIKDCPELCIDSDWPLDSIVEDRVKKVVSKFQLRKKVVSKFQLRK